MSFGQTLISWTGDLALCMADRDLQGVERMFPPPFGLIGSEVGDEVSSQWVTVTVTPKGWEIRTKGLIVALRDDGPCGISVRWVHDPTDPMEIARGNLARNLREARKVRGLTQQQLAEASGLDRKSTRLNSSHVSESRMPSSA